MRVQDWLHHHARLRPQTPFAVDGDHRLTWASGTTGRPKGAVLTHRAIVDHLHQLGLAMPLFPVGPAR